MKLKKLIAMSVCLMMTTSAIPVKVYGSPAQVSTDEAVYANLDYYGDVTDLSVVKGVSLNGLKQFTDYGEYSNVTNMSGHSKPVIEDGSITWNLQDYNKRFYYECVPEDKDSIAMPWTFDISYKLNGVPIDADELRGKAGLVEIEIKAEPNKDISEYYQNNMLLQIVSLIDMEKTLSIEAPGAQLQSMGTYKAVLFSVLPGEEETFSIRIGTDSFESNGIEMTMMPGTADALKKIKELKDVKDDVKDSFDSVNESLDSVFKTFGSMSTNLSSLKKELNSLNGVINNMSDSKDEVNGDTDALIEKLNDLSSEISNLTPYFSKSVQCITETNNDVNSIVTTLAKFKDQTKDYQSYLSKIQNTLTKIQDELNNTQGINDQVTDSLDELDDELDKLKDKEKDMKSSISDVNDSLITLNKELDSTKTLLQYMAGVSTDPTVVQMSSHAVGIISSMEGTIEELDDLNDDLESSLKVGIHLNDNLSDLIDCGEDYINLIDKQIDNGDDLINVSNKLISKVKDSLSVSDELIGKVETLNDTADKYYKDAVDMVNSAKDLNDGINGAVSSTSDLITSVEKIITDNQDNLKDSRNGSVQSILALIDKTIDLSDDSGLLNKSNNSIHDTVDNKIDDIEDDSNILNLDSEEGLISFTSDKNPAPESVQIIVRTKEITLDDDDDDNNDLEKEAENKGILYRIANIFKKLAACFKEEE